MSALDFAPCVTAATPPAPREHLDLIPGLLRGRGVEIGAFRTPLPGISPVYLDRFAEYAGEPTGADYYGDATDIPFGDSSLDYVASSHVLEHVANPLAALREWYRVLRHQGIIYAVIPDRRKTFDHPRPLTSLAHLLQDYQRGTTQVDPGHIDEFVYGIDWSLFSPATPPEEVPAAQAALITGYRQAIRQGTEINIHFHTFEPASVAALFACATALGLPPGSLQVTALHESFPASNPNGILVIARVHKPVGARVRATLLPRGLARTARRMAAAPISAGRTSA